MTPEEARTVLDVMTEADGGCPYCVADLFKTFRKHFPEYIYIVNEKIAEHKLEDYIGEI